MNLSILKLEILRCDSLAVGIMDKSKELMQKRFCLPKDRLEAILSGKVVVSLDNLFLMSGNLYIPFLS